MCPERGGCAGEKGNFLPGTVDGVMGLGEFWYTVPTFGEDVNV